jgi:hypothetical protein
MNSVLAFDDTSTWASKSTSGSGWSGRGFTLRGRDIGAFFAHQDLAGATLPWRDGSSFASAFSPAPGVALGMATPSVIKAAAEKLRDFAEAVRAGIILALEMAAADEIDQPHLEIWKSALLKILPYASLITAPLVHPLQLGGVGLEWHDHGMNIELRFRGEDDVFAVIEDARGELQEFYGRDAGLRRSSAALNLFMQRQA